MSAERVSLDTNILVYAVDQSAGQKHQQALAVVESVLRRDCLLAFQSLSEFYFAVTRKGRLPGPIARNQVENWQRLFPVVVPRPDTINRAMAGVETHQLGFWDAMLWATVRDGGATLLLSEDFQHGRVLDGVRIVNPFVSSDYLLQP
jgi:predicted nucleic acid-binding protein